MRRFSDRHGLHTVTEINITPLLDLAFVLLIIFMITTPLMENSTDLVLPESKSGTPAPAPDKIRAVSIQADGTISYGDVVLGLEELEQRIAEARATEPELAVMIRSDRAQPVQRFSEVLDALKRAGVKRIGFATNPAE
jgi:biopolymer transport protein ExbD